jgi:hypothetical protein
VKAKERGRDFERNFEVLEIKKEGSDQSWKDLGDKGEAVNSQKQRGKMDHLKKREKE